MWSSDWKSDLTLVMIGIAAVASTLHLLLIFWAGRRESAWENEMKSRYAAIHERRNSLKTR